MSTTNLLTKYRPVRIGFLIRDGSIEDLVTAAGLNTLLYGGIYNPVIPVSTSGDFADCLIKLFNVDVLYPVSHTSEIDALLAKKDFLRIMRFFDHQIFQENWDTKKNKLGYLDISHLINYYWEKTISHKPEEYESNCSLIRWNEDDPLKNLFSISFGYFPTSFNLETDFENAFLKGLRAKEVSLLPNEPITNELRDSIAPLSFTALELRGYGGTYRGNGIYIGEETDFTDLCYFWNLRAAGLAIAFLPKKHITRYKEFIQSHLTKLDEKPNPAPQVEDYITVYYQLIGYQEIYPLFEKFGKDHPEVQKLVKKQQDDAQEIRDILNQFQITKSWVHDHRNEFMWNGLSIKAATYYFGESESIAHVEKADMRYKVVINLPGKPLVKDTVRTLQSQHLAVSITTLTEFEYPAHTLKPPFIQDLSKFYSGQLAFDIWKVKSQKDGIAAIIDTGENVLTLFPIPHRALIQKLFDYVGIRTEISRPGLITQKIIEKLNGLEGGRVFKIRGVRRLLASLSKDDAITRSQATQTIFREAFFTEERLRFLLGTDFDQLNSQYFSYNENENEKKYIWKDKLKLAEISDDRLRSLYQGDFKKFENLHIEPRLSGTLTPSQVFSYLLKKDFFRSGLQLRCGSCQSESWLSLREIDDYWICTYCGGNNQTSLQLKDRDWRFRKSGLFGKDDNQEGAIPVILTLLQFLRVFQLSRLIYSPALNLKADSNKCEIDFCILQPERGESIELGIGECKSQGGEITQQDIDNLKLGSVYISG